MLGLEVEPELGVHAEPVAEAECCVAGDGAFAGDDLADAVGGDGELAGEFGGGDAEVVELVFQDFAGVDGTVQHAGGLSVVVVDDLDLAGSWLPVRPAKADAPLLVDPDRVLASAIAVEGFEAVAAEGAQGVERGGCVEDREPAGGLGLEALELPDELAGSEAFGCVVAIAQAHWGGTVPIQTSDVKRTCCVARQAPRLSRGPCPSSGDT